MSNRRKPGEIVRRIPGSGFCGSAEPQRLRVPEGKTYEMDCTRNPTGKWQRNLGGEASVCMMGCGDRACREWANVEIVSGPHSGEFMYHVSECQMLDDDKVEP